MAFDVWGDMFLLENKVLKSEKTLNTIELST